MTAALFAQAGTASGGSDPNLLLWAFGLLALAFVLLTLELFLPSGGLLGLGGGIAALAAVGCFFAEDTALGFASLLGLAVVTPVLIGVGLKIWPHTPIGRRLVLGDAPSGPAVGGAGELPSEASTLPVVGDVGETITPLRRVGSGRFGGVRIECIAEAGIIAAGVRVVVSRVSGNEVFVREADAAAAPLQSGRKKERK